MRLINKAVPPFVFTTFTAPMEDNTGGSDSGSIVCSEFSSTPDTSVQSTPEPSPAKKARVDVEPSTSKEVKQSRGKDLTLLMKGNTKGHALPKDSLYFREMARSKTTARKKGALVRHLISS